MSPLFEILPDQNTLRQLSANQEKNERLLQRLIEENLKQVFNTQFIASEFVLSGEPGRIDTLGLDANGSPTIIEYKRSRDDTVVGQGLTYVGWLRKHQGDFEIAAKRKLQSDVTINWARVRLIIVAYDFNKWDMGNAEGADRRTEIELWRYIKYEKNYLFLEQSYPRNITSAPAVAMPITEAVTNADAETYTVQEHAQHGDETIGALFLSLRNKILSLAGDEGEIIETPRQKYVAYRHGRNFCEVEVQKQTVKVYVDVLFNELEERPEIASDVSQKRHWGTGSTLFRLKTAEDVNSVMKAISQSYQRTL
jgi:predicted transport protein